MKKNIVMMLSEEIDFRSVPEQLNMTHSLLHVQLQWDSFYRLVHFKVIIYITLVCIVTDCEEPGFYSLQS